MKRLILTLLLLVTVVAGALAQNDAVYVYRNDGKFNAFFKSEIDSMSYSHYDADSVYHNDWQAQMVYTADSVYYIPLEVIDSVAFYAPETIVNKNVFELTAAHDMYLSDCDTVSFTLSTEIPSYMRPDKNNIVVSTYDCMSFPDGIMAEVLSVSSDGQGYHYNCRKVGLDRVYDQLVFIVEGYIDERNGALAKSKERLPYERELWNKTYSETLEKGGTTTVFTVNDAAKMLVTANIQKGKSPYFRLDLQNDLNAQVQFDATSSFEKYYEKRITQLALGRIRIPQCPLLFIVPKLTLSAYFAEGGTVSLGCQGHYKRTDKLSFTYEDKAWSISHAPINDASMDVASLSMEGYAEVGVIPDILFSFCGTASGLGLEYSVGLKESVNFKFDMVAAFDEGVYSAMKDSYARTTLPQSFRAYAQVGLWGDGVQPASFKYSIEPKLGEDRYLLPSFTKPEFSQGASASTALLRSEVSRNLLIPVSIGMSFYDEENNLIETQYKPIEYISEKQWGMNGLECVFDKMVAGKTYTAYPMVKIMGKELRAVPSTKFPDCFTCPDGNHPHAIDLGLPSGTKWCCCNVGASTPEGYGGYYAWGETSEKSVYNWETYAFYDNANGNYINIGSDISGTQYDVATVRMGAPWRMPTHEQQVELMTCCKRTWTQQNGVNGILFTGPNGGQVFFPAAGRRWSGDLSSAGSFGFYWSSSLNPYYGNSACNLDFNSGNWNWYNYDRGYGQSVRPVCP
ncbi:MAG: hypothetical protein J6C65_03655 [Prevotella sp.]|nr:hypothetical protein [Prevotella sp.]MBO5204570.1 hypothetical protein [Prevotella sp.]